MNMIEGQSIKVPFDGIIRLLTHLTKDAFCMLSMHAIDYSSI